MDRFSEAGKFQWRKIWLVPAAIMLAGVLALAGLFDDSAAKENVQTAPAATTVADRM